MKITLNDHPYEVEEGCSLAAFVEHLGLTTNGIAVAIDLEVVPRERWAETMLSEAMELILIHAVSGG